MNIAHARTKALIRGYPPRVETKADSCMGDLNEMQHVIGLSSDVHSACQECSDWIGARSDFTVASVAEAANHYVQAHGYRIVHVGQETGQDNEGRPHQHTVIVVGTTDRSSRDRVAAEREARSDSIKVGIRPGGLPPEKPTTK